MLNYGYFINQIWKDDVLVKSEKLQNASIYAVKLNGKWLYTGGLNKAINIQVCISDTYLVPLELFRNGLEASPVLTYYLLPCIFLFGQLFYRSY